MIGSGYEFGVRFVWFPSTFVFIDSFIDSFMLLLILTENFCMHSFMFLFISSLMSIIMKSLRSLIISDPCFFQFVDLFDSESNVMSSRVSRVIVL